MKDPFTFRFASGGPLHHRIDEATLVQRSRSMVGLIQSVLFVCRPPFVPAGAGALGDSALAGIPRDPGASGAEKMAEGRSAPGCRRRRLTPIRSTQGAQQEPPDLAAAETAA